MQRNICSGRVQFSCNRRANAACCTGNECGLSLEMERFST